MCSGLVRPIAFPLHHGDRERAGDRDVTGRRTRDHSQQGAENDRGLGRSGRHAARQHVGKPEKETAGAEFREKGAEDGEQDDVGGRHADGNAVDALAGERQERNHALKAHASPVQHAGQIRRDHGVGQKHRRDHGEEIAGCPPRSLHHQEDDHDAHDDIRGRRGAAAERDVLPAGQQVDAGAHGREKKQRDQPRAATPPARLRGIAGEQKDQPQHHRQVHGAHDHGGQHQQPGHIGQVEQPERQGQRANQPRAQCVQVAATGSAKYRAAPGCSGRGRSTDRAASICPAIALDSLSSARLS